MRSQLMISRLLGLRNSTIFRRLTVYGTSASVSQVIMMVYGLLLARQMGQERYGLFASNYAIAAISVFLVNWGMDTWMLREGGTHTNPVKLSGTVLLTKFATGVGWFVLLVSIAPLVRPDLYPRTLLLIVALDQLFDSFLITFISGLNIARRTNQASQIMLITRAIRLGSALALILLLQSRSPFDYALLRFAATFIGVCFGMLLLRPSFDVINLVQPAETLRASFVYGMTDLLALIYAQIDVTLLGFLAKVGDVGEYAPGVNLINALTVVPNSVFYILVPTLTKAFLTEHQQFAKAVRQMTAIYLIIGLVLAAGTAFALSPLLVLLLGPEYEKTSWIVLLMSPIPLLKAMSFAGATYLVVVGKQTKRIGTQLVSAAVNVVLNLVFIPLYGPAGAGVIYVISELVLMIGYLSTAFYYYRFRQGPGS